MTLVSKKRKVYLTFFILLIYTFGFFDTTKTGSKNVDYLYKN